MMIEVNGTRLYFDVEGAGLVTDGDRMRQRPTLLLLHGGPGADHSIYKPAFSALTDVAQVVYLDHRGNGRSDGQNPETWTLAQWGDDVRAFCEALRIERPIVLGVSFGGFVAQSYATRHPDHPGALILASTAARIDFEVILRTFGELGGPDAEAAARDYWMEPSSVSRLRYREICLPLYTVTRAKPDWVRRAIIKDDVALWFNGPHNEMGRMDFREDLARVTCPTQIMYGDQDPMTPPVFHNEIAEGLVNAAFRMRRFERAGHGIVPDRPDAAFEAIRDFIRSVA
ncbi:MAG: alpha/beta fold hydrolase [Pseudomonadota bacterium]